MFLKNAMKKAKNTFRKRDAEASNYKNISPVFKLKLNKCYEYASCINIVDLTIYLTLNKFLCLQLGI